MRRTDCCVEYLMLITILGQNKVLCVGSSNRNETRRDAADRIHALAEQYCHLRFDLMLRFGISSYTYLRFCLSYVNYIYA